MVPKLDISSLIKALVSLEDALSQPMDEYRRDGVIQRFEYTFELSWKTMKRLLKLEGIEASSPMQVLREAKLANIIEDFEQWSTFLKMRNLSSHTYNETTAEEVFEIAVRFPSAVKSLIQVIEKRIAEL